MVSVVILSGHFKLDDALIGVFSTTSKILASIVYGFATVQWEMYIGSIIDVINGTSLIAMRSIASKLVTNDELGKVNSLLGVAESLVPLVYAPLYARIYTETLSTFPGTFFLVGGGMTVPALVIFAWVYLLFLFEFLMLILIVKSHFFADGSTNNPALLRLQTL